MTKKTTDLTGLLSEGSVVTSAQETKIGTNVSESVQLSVRIDRARYNRLKKAGVTLNLSHREAMTDALDLWLRENGF